jgi:hypothetical protein
MYEVSTRTEAVKSMTLNQIEDTAAALDMDPGDLALRLLEYRDANQ